MQEDRQEEFNEKQKLFDEKHAEIMALEAKESNDTITPEEINQLETMRTEFDGISQVFE